MCLQRILGSVRMTSSSIIGCNICSGGYQHQGRGGGGGGGIERKAIWLIKLSSLYNFSYVITVGVINSASVYSRNGEGEGMG